MFLPGNLIRDLVACEGQKRPCALSLQLYPTLQRYGPQPPRILCPWDSPVRNTGVGCHVLLQGVFLTQGLNLRLLSLLHCRQVLYPQSHLGSSRSGQLIKTSGHRKVLSSWIRNFDNPVPWRGDSDNFIGSLGLKRPW